MKGLLQSCILLVILFLYIPLFAQKKNIQIAPTPTWVTVNAVNYSNSKGEKDADDGYIDLAFERQVSLSQQEVYCRKAIRILSDAGVQNSSEVNVGFDPSYESITFHTIRIIRGKEVLNKLDRSKFKILQQEEELDKYLYNGSLSAVLFLEDVRKGDVIEYSYSLKGFNPIFKEKYTGNFAGNFSVPLGLLYYKLIVPKGRFVTIKREGQMIEPSVSQQPNETVYEWKLTDVPAFHLEDRVPSWYEPYNNVAISEYTSWKEVNDWAQALFPASVSLSASMQQKVAEIKNKYSTPEEQAVAALRFVQDEVRYLGMEMGEGSHRPNNPDKVLAQRFGDCKDKSYLLLTLLRGLNMEAYPVLINTAYKKALLNWLPSATAFDHVTVQLKLKGQTYWFDPTINYQRGTIQQIAYPNYQCGLVISPQTTGLTVIPLQDKGSVVTKEKFVVKDRISPVRLMVTTKYTGSHADNMRNDFNSSSMHDMKKVFEDFYKSYYEKLTIDSLQYADNEQTGELTTYEWYTIPNFWKKEKSSLRSSFSPFMLNSVIKTPNDEKRAMPFATSYPNRYTEDIVVELPGEWDISASRDEFKNANFFLETSSNYSKGVLQLHYKYESQKDHVSPEEMGKFLADMDRVDEESGYRLTWGLVDSIGGSSVDKFDTTSSIYSGLYVVLGVCVFITFLIRRWKQQNGR
ncbi:DUF3857 domain-containing protein [Flavisolibacter tropicus]|uniref:DUF3857 domain-containing protein n=1 Tax=Flavisolibacter tropicus TaxID=1492898 RepID=A0A172TWK1_9BACT|nr:DUF3857 domain-containing transglutaminase family protein [Flavisolibacter tropicus]ANE51348.1 hypothetical protein SY85_13330 [Flavisolibacter tropicus]